MAAKFGDMNILNTLNFLSDLFVNALKRSDNYSKGNDLRISAELHDLRSKYLGNCYQQNHRHLKLDQFMNLKL